MKVYQWNGIKQVHSDWFINGTTTSTNRSDRNTLQLGIQAYDHTATVFTSVSPDHEQAYNHSLKRLMRVRLPLQIGQAKRWISRDTSHHYLTCDFFCTPSFCIRDDRRNNCSFILLLYRNSKECGGKWYLLSSFWECNWGLEDLK